MNTDPNRLLTSHDVGRLLQMDPSSVVKWVNDGLLPAYRTPGGHRRIRASDLVAFLREHGMYIPEELKAGPTRVLVVDDDANLLKALGRSMKSHREQIELQSCSSGIDALVKVGAQKPDVLVMDVHMPELDGLEVLKRLKANAETKDVTVILFTGKPSAELERKALEFGAKALLPKPLTAATLAAALGPSSEKSAARQ